MQRTILCLTVLILSSSSVFAQKAERKHVREGNDLYKSEKFTESEIERLLKSIPVQLKAHIIWEIPCTGRKNSRKLQSSISCLPVRVKD